MTLRDMFMFLGVMSWPALAWMCWALCKGTGR